MGQILMGQTGTKSDIKHFCWKCTPNLDYLVDGVPDNIKSVLHFKNLATDEHFDVCEDHLCCNYKNCCKSKNLYIAIYRCGETEEQNIYCNKCINKGILEMTDHVLMHIINNKGVRLYPKLNKTKYEFRWLS